MNLLKIQKHFALAVSGSFLMVGIGSQAVAAPTFTVDPNSIDTSNNASPTNFQADFINGSTTERLVLDTTTNTATGVGILQLSSFGNNGVNLLPGVTDSGVDYQLYITFDIATSLVSGPFGGANSLYNIDSLNFSMYMDPTLNTTFTGATTALDPTRSNFADDIMLGFGSLIPTTLNAAGFDSGFGAYINAFTSYTNTAAGDNFFIDPVPFYNVAFSAFNNTTGGATRVGDNIAINNAVGGVDFNRVPEPAILALFSIGLMGIGASSLRRRKLS